jgi:2-polyprenyl-6-methoxyphenol hydroxylase-like FAD-dependent oxidoreductase
VQRRAVTPLPTIRSMTAHDILLRGAGAVGLAAALALARQGLRVALLDTNPAAAAKQDDVRAFALNAASIRLLTELKVWDALPAHARTPVHDMRVQGDSPGAVLDFSAWQQGQDTLAWIVDAAAMEHALRSAARFAPHITWVSAEVPAALAVIAEGKHSSTRDTQAVPLQRQAYGQRAIAARLVSDQTHANLARQWFCSPDVLALLPLDQPTAGHGYGLVWSVPETRATELMALSEIDFANTLMAVTGGAAGHLSLASARSQWPLSVARALEVHGPGWVLVGDAAHVVHPLAGQGLNLGLADVVALADTVAQRESWRGLGDAKLLARYARSRLGPTQAMLQVTDGLLQLFAAEQPAVKALRNQGLNWVNRLSPLKRLLVKQALGDSAKAPTGI